MNDSPWQLGRFAISALLLLSRWLQSHTLTIEKFNFNGQLMNDLVPSDLSVC